MPQFTLPLHTVAYNLYSKLNTADPQIQPSVAGLQVQVPGSVVANTGAIVTIGRPDSRTAPTAIANAELELNVGDSDSFPAQIGNDISLPERWIQSTVDNTVVFCNVTQA